MDHMEVSWHVAECGAVFDQSEQHGFDSNFLQNLANSLIKGEKAYSLGSNNCWHFCFDLGEKICDRQFHDDFHYKWTAEFQEKQRSELRRGTIARLTTDHKFDSLDPSPEFGATSRRNLADWVADYQARRLYCVILKLTGRRIASHSIHFVARTILHHVEK